MVLSVTLLIDSKALTAQLDCLIVLRLLLKNEGNAAKITQPNAALVLKDRIEGEDEASALAKASDSFLDPGIQEARSEGADKIPAVVSPRFLRISRLL